MARREYYCYGRGKKNLPNTKFHQAFGANSTKSDGIKA